VEAREVYSMKLDTVSLVALSACETGLGKVSRGDEIWGFTRSFLSAGAPSLMVSLWPVADESTEKLMKRFYAEMTKGIDRRRALQAAQLDVMRDPRFSAPYFWAAFNLVGDWR
jgi:CHAT domain-containing protein